MKHAAWTLPLLFLLGCMVIPEPTPQMAGGDEAVLRRLREGRSLYVNKCSGCHSLMAPNRYSDARWREEVDEMVELGKVKLRDADRERLLLYLTTANDVE